MKSAFTKGLLASAAAFAIAGAFAQVQTGDPSNGSKLGVTPPPSTSSTTDTSRLSSDCSQVAADQRSNQAGGPQVNAMTNCGHRETMGAAGTAATPAVVGSTSGKGSSTTASTAPASNGTAMSSDTGSTNVASSGDTGSSKPKHRKAKADRG